MNYFPYILTGIIACCAVIAWILISRINEEDNEGDGFFSRKIRDLEDYLLRKSSPVGVKQFLAIMVAIEIGLFLLGFLIAGKWWFGLFAMIAGPFIPRFYFSILESKNKEKFEVAYRDTLNHISFSLRAGLSVPNAIENMANFALGDSYMRKMFVKMDAKLKSGATVGEVFDWFALKTNSEDAKTVAAAVRMQQEVGGSEAYVLEQMAETIQRRLETRSEISSILTDTEIMIKVFDVAPIIMVIGLYVLFPSYVQYYFEEPLRFMILVGIIACFVVGSIITRLMRKSVML